MPRYGIDTSIFVRLLTGDPEKDYLDTKAALETILKNDPAAEIEVSNMVIAEAYFVLQHHFGINKMDSRVAMTSVLTSGLVKAQNGENVMEALSITTEPGLLDRLILIDYTSNNLVTLSNDRKMSRLPKTQLL